MTILSRGVGKWLSTNPGLIKATSLEELWAVARLTFMKRMRVREDQCPPLLFQQFLMNCGYRPETRTNHDTGEVALVLALPGGGR